MRSLPSLSLRPVVGGGRICASPTPVPLSDESPSRSRGSGRPVLSGVHCRGAEAQAGMMIVQESCTILQISKGVADKVGGDAMVAEKIGEDVMDSINRPAPKSGPRAGREE